MKHLLVLLMLSSIPSLAQKKLLRQAEVFEASEQYALASEKYREVLYKNAAQAMAISGLQRTAQKVIDKKLSAYFITRNSGKTASAIEEFEGILHYQEELKYFNISLQIPAYYYSDYEEDKQRLKEEDKTNNEKKQDELYLEALKLFEQSRWVDAWDVFKTIGSYRDASDYARKIESKAKRISIVENNKNRLSSEDVMRNNLQSDIIKLKNPLIRIISRDNLNQVIEEQKLGLSGLFDEQSVADLGKLLGVELMLFTRVLDVQMVGPISSTQNKTAYTASIKQVYDPVTQTTNSKREYFPVAYQEHSIQGRLEMSFQYQLIDVTTAEVLTAEVINEIHENNLTYGSYNGDPNALYPSDGTSIYTKGKERAAFLELFSQGKKPLSKEEMESKLQKSLSQKVAQSLDNYFKNM